MANQKTTKEKTAVGTSKTTGTSKKTGTKGRTGTAKKTEAKGRSGTAKANAGKTARVSAVETKKKSSSSVVRNDKEDKISDSMKDEIVLAATLLVSILFFLSYINLCGTVGKWLNYLIFGLIGIFGYLFPFLLFFAVAFGLANRGSRVAQRKMLSLLGAFVCIAALVELTGGYNVETKWYEYFVLSATEKRGGGIVGGIFVRLLCPLFETVATVAILVVLLLICLMLLTGKELFAYLKRLTSETMEGRRMAAEERMARRQENDWEEDEVEAEGLEEQRRARIITFPKDSEKELAELAESKAEKKKDRKAGETIRFVDALKIRGGKKVSKQNSADFDGNIAPEETKTEEEKNVLEEPEEEQKLRAALDNIPISGQYQKDGVLHYEEELKRKFGNREEGSSEGYGEPDTETMVGKQVRLIMDADKQNREVYRRGLVGEKIVDRWGLNGDSEVNWDSFPKDKNGKPSLVGEAEERNSQRFAGVGEETDSRRFAGAGEETNSRRFAGVGEETDSWKFAGVEEDTGYHGLETSNGSAGSWAVESEAEIGHQKKAEAWAEAEKQKWAVPEEPEEMQEPKTEDSIGEFAESGDMPDRMNFTKNVSFYPKEVPAENMENLPGQEWEAEARGKAESAAPVSPVLAAQGNTESPVDGIGKANERKAQRVDSPDNDSRTVKEEEASAAREEIVRQMEQTIPEKKYEFPPYELLAEPQPGKGANERELKETAMKLQKTLESFGVHVTVTNISCGPTVTQYELQPEQGVKVSQITKLSDDIKLNMAAADIRIEAPIPGKAAVGIEIPNKENTPVLIRELLESEEFQEHKSKLAFAVGKNISGQTIVADIAKMPHLLIAGATGSGKSVCINTIIMSILYKADPKEVRLIMVDPKVVELSVYNGIPHLLIPVVTDPKKASAALNWAVAEMTDRYNKFAELGVRDLAGYNERIASVEEKDPKYQKLPQIVIIVDELADLMMVASGEVEEAICRLAQLARAAGLHLVIATQRPTVNVITGLIKANVPSRIAFAVASAVDSRTILDGVGAEKLLGKGDMLFFPSGYPKPVRIQGAFVSDAEVGKVVDFLKEQSAGSSYNEEVSKRITSTASEGSSSSERDDYFVEAGKFIIEKEKASIGMLQRVYKIGFNRAARIMDQLTAAGVVGPEEGTKPRKILMSMEEFEEYIENVL